MDLIDSRYIGLLSSRLEKFSKKNYNLYNFRCPICGDSKTNKTKARGYFYTIKNNTNYKCHNCGVNISFNNFLKKFDSKLHSEYCLEKFKNGSSGKNFITNSPEFNFIKPQFNKQENKINLPKSSDNIKSKIYLENRKLDPDKFFYAKEFKKWTNTFIKIFDDKSLKYDEERIVIPLIYKNNLIGFQGRSIEYNPVKYITIMLSHDSPKIYGYDSINLLDKVYIVEGPFDSCFVKNSLAMCGADVNLMDLNISRPVYVYDNEPRNVEIHKRMNKQINLGNEIVIWPNTIRQKDINDMVLFGHSVQSVIESNTYSGLTAKLKFNEWKRYE